MSGKLAGISKFLTPDRFKYVIRIEDITIDNKIFAIHYRLTSVVFLVFSVVLSAVEWFGTPISCIKQVGDNKVEQKAVDRYCWVEGTFTLPHAILDSMERESMVDKYGIPLYPHDGVDQYVAGSPPDEIIEHRYYQWVAIVLALQGLAFFITRRLWKVWEKGVQKQIVDNLFKSVYDKKQMEKHQKSLVEYLYQRRGKHTAYAFRFFLCEVLNVVHVVLQMAFISWFLGGRFWGFGFHVMAGTRPDPMVKIFPRITKCQFSKYGPSGDVQKHDNLCILPLNIMNEKIYIFLWFYLVILGFLSLAAVIWKIVIIGFPRARYIILHTFNRIVPERYFQTVVDRISYGDWFLLYLLSKNLDIFHFRDVMIQLAQRLDQGSPSGSSQDTSQVTDEIDAGLVSKEKVKVNLSEA